MVDEYENLTLTVTPGYRYPWSSGSGPRSGRLDVPVNAEPTSLTHRSNLCYFGLMEISVDN